MAGDRFEDRAAHERFEQRQLVAVLVERRGALERGAPRLPRRSFVDASADESGLRRLGAVRHRRGGAENDRGAPAAPIR